MTDFENSRLNYFANSELVNHHNDNFFSEFELLEDDLIPGKNYGSIDQNFDNLLSGASSFLITINQLGQIQGLVGIPFQNLLGNHSDLTEKSVWELFPQSVNHLIKKNINLVLSKKHIRTFNISFEKDNSDLLYEIKIFPTPDDLFLLYFQEISKRKLKEDSLQKSDDLLKSIWNNSFDAMRLIDHNGKVIAANRAYYKLFGVNSDEIIGKKFDEIYKKGSESSGKNSTGEMWDDGLTENFECEIQTKNSRTLVVNIMNTRVVNVFSNLISNPSEKFLLLSVFRDVTDRIKNENKIGDTERLTTFGKMSAYLAHQLKTPLATIRMNLEMLEKSSAIPEDNIRSFKIIGKEITRLNKLLQNTFLFLKRSDNILITIDLFELINSIEQFFEPILAEKKITFVNNVEHYFIKGDYQKIRTVFIHLIENSIEALLHNGLITITSSKSGDKPGVSVMVLDNGGGIADPSYVFETFYTTKSSGTGLGLSIVKHLLTEMNGSVKLVSSDEQGTAFEVFLPINSKAYGKNISN